MSDEQPRMAQFEVQPDEIGSPRCTSMVHPTALPLARAHPAQHTQSALLAEKTAAVAAPCVV
ncbi:MAG: hypothetical protein H6953_14890 [Chromatiaceae bacterium]|nr:hypothetical protein [Chromatiaceae bacterium]MCP5421770.1 hypothetical protein [Chromatiaceae bacterium]